MSNEVSDKVQTSAWDHPLGRYLPEGTIWRNGEGLDPFLKYVEEKGLTLYDAQEEAILNIFEGENVILNTPTGSGKSLVALAMHFNSLCANRRSYYTCPIKALVNEKFLSLCKEFGPQFVGMITGDASVNPLAPIICCTAEILMNQSLRDGENMDVHDIIMDEFHYYSDSERGVAWQVPLLTLPKCHFLLMSATMGDCEFFQKHLQDFTGFKTAIVSSDNRPVPLDFTYIEEPLEQTVQDILKMDKTPIYIVNFTQRECAQNAQAFMSINFCSKEEKNAIAKELEGVPFNSPYGKEIKKMIKHGIGIHHGGLLPKYRVLVEILAQKGLLKIICGTDTLGVGVNVPIRSVLFTKLCKYNGQKTAILSAREFHQISGRAGRKGFDSLGSIYCMAPAHVIENIKLERKAQLNPKLKKKMVKAKPPEKGFVIWNEETFNKLISSQPEPLQSRFSVSHAMILSVLSRPGDGCRAMKNLISKSHESDKAKEHHRKKAFQLFRSLVKKDIIEIVPPEERDEENQFSKIRINMDLQDDFSLNETLALYLLETLPRVDPMDPDYHYTMLSLTESILENPQLILHKQIDKIKREMINQLKSEGMDYSDRLDAIEDVEYPKPLADFIYNTFNEFSSHHPWVGQENIKPKSIAREMYENYQTFPEYIKEYGLERVEGLLLRYLSNVYKVLVQTVPFQLKNDDVDDMTSFFETIIKTTDSSLVDEWEKIRNPTWTKEQIKSTIHEDQIDITKNEKAFMLMIRNGIYNFVRSLTSKQFGKALYCLEDRKSLEESCEDINLLKSKFANIKIWTIEELQILLTPFIEEHGDPLINSDSRRPENTEILPDSERDGITVKQYLMDKDGEKNWYLQFYIDYDLSKMVGKPVLSLEGIERE